MAYASPYYTRMLAEHRAQGAWARDRVALLLPASGKVIQVMATQGEAAVNLVQQSTRQIATAEHGTRPRG